MGATTALLAQLGAMGLGAYNKAALGTSKLEPNSAGNHAEALAKAAKQRAAEIAPDAAPLKMGINFVSPDPNNMGAMAQHAHGFSGADEVSRIDINPFTDASYLAHEMGHAVAQKTEVGKNINKARHAFRNVPKLGKSMVLALSFAVPAVASALQAGDDDTAETLALAAAINSPTLIDEALATKNALAIMDNAGMRATLGQRGRLAGGYLSYVAPTLIAGGLGNFAGNLADDYTAVYDL